jgi:hypothetical protein
LVGQSGHSSFRRQLSSEPSGRAFYVRTALNGDRSGQRRSEAAKLCLKPYRTFDTNHYRFMLLNNITFHYVPYLELNITVAVAGAIFGNIGVPPFPDRNYARLLHSLAATMPRQG